MKKILAFTISLLACFMVMAQDETAEETSPEDSLVLTYKQAAGDNSLELALAPFGSFPVFQLPAGFGIRYRKFNSTSRAFRIGVELSFANYVEVTQQANDPLDVLELKDKLSSFGITVRPGFEQHLFSSERLSPYFGGEVILGWKTSRLKSEVQTGSRPNVKKPEITKNGQFTDGFTFGVGAVAGVDFYVARKLYLGLELNYSIRYFSRAKEKFTDTDGNERISNNGSTLTIAPAAFSFFRIGYLF